VDCEHHRCCRQSKNQPFCQWWEEQTAEETIIDSSNDGEEIQMMKKREAQEQKEREDAEASQLDKEVFALPSGVYVKGGEFDLMLGQYDQCVTVSPTFIDQCQNDVFKHTSSQVVLIAVVRSSEDLNAIQKRVVDANNVKVNEKLNSKRHRPVRSEFFIMVFNENQKLVNKKWSKLQVDPMQVSKGSTAFVWFYTMCQRCRNGKDHHRCCRHMKKLPFSKWWEEQTAEETIKAPKIKKKKEVALAREQKEEEEKGKAEEKSTADALSTVQGHLQSTKLDVLRLETTLSDKVQKFDAKVSRPNQAMASAASESEGNVDACANPNFNATSPIGVKRVADDTGDVKPGWIRSIFAKKEAGTAENV